jgi:hypothetical protein
VIAAEWFAAYVYLRKLRDEVVLHGAIRDALAKLDPFEGVSRADLGKDTAGLHPRDHARRSTAGGP